MEEVDKILPITYLNGVLVGVNGIKDGYLWVDSPDCFFFKAGHIHGNHDFNSLLRKSNGKHKILSTIADVDNIIDNKNDGLEKMLFKMVESRDAGCVFVTSMPMSQVIGFDYDSIINKIKLKIDKPIFNIPSRTMTSCWLDGYSDLLFSIARNIEIGKLDFINKKNVAIVGNFFDRNELDSIGNVNELYNIFTGLGLNVVSIWLSGNNFEDLKNISKAGTIISLPYGRKAAKKISNRLGIGLLELDLPFGFQNTISFIKNIGEYFGIDDYLVNNFIDIELKKNNIEIIRNTINNCFLGKRISFFTDPYIQSGIFDFSSVLGFEVVEKFIHGTEKHLLNNKSLANTSDLIFGIVQNIKEVDLFITNTSFDLTKIKLGKTKILEFGFPSYTNHSFYEKPYYGIKGAMIFTNDLFNLLLKYYDN